MKIHAVQHIPGFVDTHAPFTAEVQSVEELLRVPWIAQWAQSRADHDQTFTVWSWPNGVPTERVETKRVKARSFHRWSVADPGNSRQTLMVEYDGGDIFYVVAFLDSDGPIPLPEWRETERARQRRERWNRGERATRES